MREELGLSITVGELLVADWAPNPSEGDKILFISNGGVISANDIGRICLPVDELSDWAFTDAAEFEAQLIPRLARRVLATLGAARHGHPVYIENGTPIPPAASD